MQCPYCNTVNRDDQESCYHCSKDLSILRLIINKGKHHYNLALEHAERGRYNEAKIELLNALDLDRKHVKSWLALGTVHQRLEDYDSARECWEKALLLDPEYNKIHDYLSKIDKTKKTLPILHRLQFTTIGLTFILAAICIWVVISSLSEKSEKSQLLEIKKANQAYQDKNYGEALYIVDSLLSKNPSPKIADSAFVIRDSIDNRIKFYLDQIDEYNNEQNFLDSLATINTVLNLRPDEKTYKTLSNIKNKVIRPLLESDIEHMLSNAGDHIDSLIEIHSLVEQFEKNYSDSAAIIQQWDEQIHQRCESIVHEHFIATTNESSENPDIASLMLSLDHTRNRINSVPELKAMFDELSKTQMRKMVDNFIEQIELMINKGDIVSALAALDSLDKSDFPDFALNEDKFSELKVKIAQLKKDTLLRELEVASSKKDWESLDDGIQRVEKLSLSEDEKQRFQNVIARLNSAKADDYHKWFANRILSFQNGRIDEETAGEAVKRWEFINSANNQIDAKWNGFKDDLYFCIGRAYLKLGDTQQAQKMFNLLTENFPDSPYKVSIAQISKDKNL